MDFHIPDNHNYYFVIGNGTWTGKFSFRMENWRLFWGDPIGLKNRFLVISMFIVQKIFGSSSIDSDLFIYPGWGPNGVATNKVRIKKFGLTLYLLEEQYVQHPDGTSVYVHSRERFGPVPFLFNATKHHPAKIHEGGMGATYMDMPLLGTLWEGTYRVLKDRKRIDARLECSWCSASEVISLVSRGTKIGKLKKKHPPGSNDLDWVIDELQIYRDWLEAVRSPIAIFTHAYLTITSLFKEVIPKQDFESRKWVLALDVAFAREYFHAVDAFALGEKIPKGWIPVFSVFRNKKTSVLEELIYAMAAHIIHDLPLALREVGMRAGDTSRIHDYHLANDVLESGIDRIQKEVAQRYNPFLGWLDRLGARQDEVLTDYGIRLARAVAWFNGERLFGTESDDRILASIAKSIRIIIEKFQKPPLLSMRIFLRFFRWLSCATRKWPGPKAF